MSALADRMQLIKTTLAARYPARVVTRRLQDFGCRKADELKKGIYTLVSLGEGGYANLRDRPAMDGKHRMLLIGQLQLPEKNDGEAIEDAEFVMVEEVKAFLAALPPALACLEMKSFRQSGQTDHPYAWIACELEIES